MDEATEACPRLSARCLFRPSGCPQSALGPGLCSLAEKGNSVGQSWARPLTSGTWVRTQDGRGHSRCQLAWRACSSMRPQDDPGPRMTPGGGLRTAHPWGRSLGGQGRAGAALSRPSPTAAGAPGGSGPRGPPVPLPRLARGRHPGGGQRHAGPHRGRAEAAAANGQPPHHGALQVSAPQGPGDPGHPPGP